MTERKKPRPFINIDVVIGLLVFEVAVDPGKSGAYYVKAYRNGDDVEDCDPSHSVEVSREDFLAMLEVAKAGAIAGRPALHYSEDPSGDDAKGGR